MVRKNLPIHSTDTTRYRFCGNGQGIPGLPHEVSAAEADQLGLLDVLQAALQNGNYQPIPISPAETAEKGE